eukprot:CAMPEP_0201509566 /NCGR_PEP_ID=MMETSP0161_2-20130828/2579_1 /ASSEMBLY_ACC=CAM_ASM_000251 /TAXON_ID=180227 /ORGANISM="Neoparamoeba aestuarina, Strain SoJaBio B1-5/56/2" /LENGTH=436 /DNA_ID=CAMNT_0047904555 /DNA_START=119 /DNA_END=1429 /DNA_ORIENTATION=-
MGEQVEVADFSAKDLFAKLQERYFKLEESSLPSSHPSVQEELMALVGGFGEAWKRAESESLFSSNEQLKEVETTSLPVLLTQFYLADVHSRVMDKRLIHLAMSNKIYRKFLDMCQSLGVIPQGQDTDTVVELMEKDRSYRVGLKKREMAAKKQQKELLEKRQDLMRKRIMAEDNFDEEMEQQMSPEEQEHIRKIHISMLELSVLKVYGELSSIKQETEILRFAEKRKQDAEAGGLQPKPPPSKPNQSSGIQMFNIGENGAINPMGEAPSKLTTNSVAAMQAAGGHGHSGGCCDCGDLGKQEVKSIQKERDPLGMGAVVQRYTAHPKDAGSSALYDKDGKPLNTMQGRTKREELQEKVFQPGWRQPTESLDSYCERMMPHAITGGNNDPTDEDLDREAAEKEEKMERDDANYLREKREWDEFKDNNPSGMGNRLRQG